MISVILLLNIRERVIGFYEMFSVENWYCNEGFFFFCKDLRTPVQAFKFETALVSSKLRQS